MTTDNRIRYWWYLGFCIALLPLLVLRDFTPSNELRYLSIADEALQNGHFFTFTNHGEPYADKPPLYLWIVMLCRSVAGSHSMWLLSLFSLIPAILTTEAMCRWTQSETDNRSSLTGGLMLLTTAFFLGLAVTIRMDMLMTLFIVLSLRSFWKIHNNSRDTQRQLWLFPLWLFMGLFTKGPVGLLMPFVSIAVYLITDRKICELAKYFGWRTWCVLLGLCLVWFCAVYAEGGSDYLNELALVQTMGRAVKSAVHARPFYFYLTTFWWTMAPWSPLVFVCYILSGRKSAYLTPLTRLFITVSLSTLVMLSCFSSKLPVYLLPAFPFFIFAALLYIQRNGTTSLIRFTLAIPALIFGLALPVAIACRYIPKFEYLTSGWISAASAALTAGGIIAMLQLYSKRGNERHLNRTAIDGPVRTLAVSLFCAIFLGGWVIPQFNDTIGFKTVAKRALDLSRRGGTGGVYTWRVKRSANMDVYLGREVKIIPEDSIPSAGNTSGGVVIVRLRQLDRVHPATCDTVGPYAILRF